MRAIRFDAVIFREGNTFVACSPRLDIASCGDTAESAKEHLKTAVRLFLEETEKLGTLEEVLWEAGYSRNQSGEWVLPLPVTAEVLAVEWT